MTQNFKTQSVNILCNKKLATFHGESFGFLIDIYCRNSIPNDTYRSPITFKHNVSNNQLLNITYNAQFISKWNTVFFYLSIYREKLTSAYVCFYQEFCLASFQMSSLILKKSWAKFSYCFDYLPIFTCFSLPNVSWLT